MTTSIPTQSKQTTTCSIDAGEPIAHWRASDSTPHLLSQHPDRCGELTSSFASKIGLAEAGLLIGLLHDLGKYSKEFQGYIKSALGLTNCDEDDYVDAAAKRGKVDHSSAGAQYIWRALSPKGSLELRVAQILALCIASHHSGLIDCLSPDGEDTFSNRMLKAKTKTHLDEITTEATMGIRERADTLLSNPELTNTVRHLIRKILLANSVDKRINQTVVQQQVGLAVRFLFSCLIDADRIDTADFEHHRVKQYRPAGCYASWPKLIGRLELFLASLPIKYDIDILRNEISQHCLTAASRTGGIFTLSVPTGGGKTLASLRFALHHAKARKLDRIIYVIPFTSIIDQNAQVVRSVLEPDDAPTERGRIVLEHHSSLTPEQQDWRQKILCENWDAPVVYTTMVQLLETLFGSGTRGARRMHQLANTVLVFDEIQTIPIQCVHLFNNAINFLAEQCNSTVVLCTATQPLLNQVDESRGAIRLAANHEMMPDRQKLFDDLKRVEVCDNRKPGGWSHTEVAELAVGEVSRTGSCLTIVNTKKAAREIFEACRKLKPECMAFHLSTDMCPAHRKKDLRKVRELLAAKKPVLCVSTQLIEAGVDVDFHTAIRFVAGLDSIAQAAGRCNRNGRPEPGTVHVVNPTEENLEYLPDIAIGRDIANRLLDDYRSDPDRFGQNIFGPTALSDYYQYYFLARRNEMSYKVGEKDVGRDDSLLSMLSANETSVSENRRKTGTTPDRLLNQSFMTAAHAFKAIDAPTQAVIVPYGDEGKTLVADLHAAYDIKFEIELLKTAQQYSVNVFPHVLKNLHQAKALNEIKPSSGIFCLDSRFYSPDFGLATEPVVLMEPIVC